MPPESEPPRKFYQLKPKEFERLNGVPDAVPAADSPAGSAAETPSPPPAPIDVRALARIATPPGPALAGRAANSRPNDVHALLAQNAAHAEAAGLNTVSPPKPRRSKRRRDYFLLLVPVNLFFAFWAFGPFANPMTLVYGLGGMALFTAGLSWLMFGVMDDY